jgi:acyl-CoA thioester hydrolase
MEYIFETTMEVRDYECDIQGIVNNANYLHYTEHTRHLFLQSLGLSFSELNAKGEVAVVARMELQYKIPLRGDDRFISRLNLEKEGLRYIFYQDIYRAVDEKLCFRAKATLVVLHDGRIAESKVYDKAFEQFFKKDAE